MEVDAKDLERLVAFACHTDFTGTDSLWHVIAAKFQNQRVAVRKVIVRAEGSTRGAGLFAIARFQKLEDTRNLLLALVAGQIVNPEGKVTAKRRGSILHRWS